jgi:hypothetical protein
MLPAGAMAAPAGTQGSDFIYEVEAGDTLIGLAARYMTSPNDWRLLQARNAVADPYRLKPGSRIRMPLSRIPVVAATARAVFVRGQVSADGKPLRTGDALRETAQIQTGPDGSATLELPDGTRVALPGGTRIEVRRLRTFARSGLTDTVIGVERGAAESRVAPNGKGVGRYEIRTPLLVTGVRGTRYRVAVDSVGTRSEVIEGRVDMGARSGEASVGAGFGVGVSAGGRLSQPVPLLPAPVVTAAPDPVMTRSLTVQWHAVDGAAGYRVGVARDATLTEWIWTAEVAAPEAVIDDLSDGRLFVAVNALAADRLTGHAAVLPIAVKRNPPAPFSLAPQPDAVAYGPDAMFRWAAVSQAEGYELAVSADPGFTRQSTVVREAGVEAHRALAEGRWWWRLRSIDTRGEPGPWGDASPLTVMPAAPLPAASDDGDALRVRWPAEAAAPSGYVVQMSRDAAFQDDVVTVRATQNEISMPRPAAGTYFIRVARAIDAQMPPAAAFGAPQQVGLPAVLRDARGGVVTMGTAGHGIETDAR